MNASGDERGDGLGGGKADGAWRVGLVARTRTTIQRVERGFVGRANLAKSLVLSMLAGCPLLVVGPPGTGKTAMARALAAAVGADFDEYALDPFSPALLLSARQRDPSRPRVVVLDDVFDVHGELAAAVRRAFDAARTSTHVVATSIDLDDREPSLVDRFVFRVCAAPLSAGEFDAMLAMPVAEASDDGGALTWEDIERIRAESESVAVPEEVRTALSALRTSLAEIPAYRSDRWWKCALSVLRTAAFVDGRATVVPDDFAIVDAMFDADDGVVRAEVRKWVQDRARWTLPASVKRIEAALAALQLAVSEDRSARSPSCDEVGRPLFRTPNGEVTVAPTRRERALTSGGEKLFVHPRNMVRSGPEPFLSAAQLYERYFVGRVSELKAYTDDEANVAVREVANDPLMEQTAFDVAHVDARAEWLANIAFQLRDARTLCERVIDGPSESLWRGPLSADADREVARRVLESLDRLVDVVRGLRIAIASLPVRA